MSLLKSVAALAFVLIGSPLSNAAETVRQHDAHEHGVSKMKIAIDNGKLEILLEAPGADIVGFEHKAESQEEKEQVHEALDLLKNPDNLFSLTSAAQCSPTSTSSEFSADDHDEDEHNKDEQKNDGHDEDEHEEGHAEFHASYAFTCASIAKLGVVDLKYFEVFSNAQEIELQIVSEFGQKAMELPREKRSFDLSTLVR